MFNQISDIMKKVIMLTIAMVLFAVPVFSQNVNPPADLITFFIGLNLFLGSWVGVAVSLPVLSAIVIGILKATGKGLKYLLTVLVAVALVLGAYFLPFGYLNEAAWWLIPLNVAGLILVEVVGFSIPFIKGVLEAIQEKFTPVD